MSTIRVVRGVGTAPTEMAVVRRRARRRQHPQLQPRRALVGRPRRPTVEVTETAPDLGPPGEALEVVQSSATVAPGERGAAGIGWARSEDGPGIFYEVDGTSEDAVRMEIREGLAAGRDLRDWEFVEENVR